MRLQPGRAPHLGIGPGIDLRPRRPVALVEPAENQAIGTLHARLDRPQDGKPRMCLPGTAHRPAGKKLRQDSGKAVAVGLEAASLFGERRQQQRRRFAILARPQMQRAVRRVRHAVLAGRLRCHPLRRVAKGRRQRGKVGRRRLPCLDKAGQGRGNRRFEECGDAGEFILGGELAPNAVDPGAGPVPAEHGKFQPAHRFAEAGRRNSARGKRVFQEGKCRHRREFGSQHGHKRFQIAAGRAL